MLLATFKAVFTTVAIAFFLTGCGALTESTNTKHKWLGTCMGAVGMTALFAISYIALK